MFEQIVTTLDIMFLSSYEQEKKIDILFLKGVRTNFSTNCNNIRYFFFFLSSFDQKKKH